MLLWVFCFFLQFNNTIENKLTVVTKCVLGVTAQLEINLVKGLMSI